MINLDSQWGNSSSAVAFVYPFVRLRLSFIDFSFRCLWCEFKTSSLIDNCAFCFWRTHSIIWLKRWWANLVWDGAVEDLAVIAMSRSLLVGGRGRRKSPFYVTHAAPDIWSKKPWKATCQVNAQRRNRNEANTNGLHNTGIKYTETKLPVVEAAKWIRSIEGGGASERTQDQVVI